MIMFRVSDHNHVELQDVVSSDDMLAAMVDGWDTIDSIRRAGGIVREAEQETKRALKARDAMRVECAEALAKVEAMRQATGVVDPWARDAFCQSQAEEIQKRGRVIEDLRHELSELAKSGRDTQRNVIRLGHSLDEAQQTIGSLNEEKRRLLARVQRLEGITQTQVVVIDEKQTEIHRLDRELEIQRAAKVKAEAALYVASTVGKRLAGAQEWYLRVEEEGKKYGNDSSS